MKQSVFVEIDTETGKLNVEGPWGDGVLFLGLLEMAKVGFFEGRAEAGEKPKFENKMITPHLTPPRKM